jgi:hypothetical protein
MPGIEDAAHFLLVLAEAARQLAFADAGGPECLEYRELCGNVGGDRDFDQVTTFRA